ncbi:MAG TPA: immunoglobulin-like domain-containing protein [Gemmatimonadaceae bacterium]|nr:immunoglobulin-like domain-containing protein [Gemmatimonadaceae bacterium]
MTAVTLIVAVAWLGGCRPRAPEGDSAQSPAPPSASEDSTSSVTGDTATVRADSVFLTTDKTRYRAGEAVTLTLDNRSGSSYAFNPCTRSIEREDKGAWTTVPEPDRMCTMEAWILDPKGSRSGQTELPSPLPPGRYRVVVRMTREAPGGGAASAVAAVSEAITVS